MEQYKLYVNDRSYSSWVVFEMLNFNKITLDINPIESKLFSNDVFSIDENKQTTFSQRKKDSSCSKTPFVDLSPESCIIITCGFFSFEGEANAEKKY